LTARQLERGYPFPLGASWDGDGTNFALYSSVAEAVELCLFDADGMQQTECLTIHRRTGNVWHTYLRGIGPGTLYGWRGSGRMRPNGACATTPPSCCWTPMRARS
jgi:isoamylase